MAGFQALRRGWFWALNDNMATVFDAFEMKSWNAAVFGEALGGGGGGNNSLVAWEPPAEAEAPAEEDEGIEEAEEAPEAESPPAEETKPDCRRAIVSMSAILS